MKSLDSEDAVGMLLFDEPSASLDPAAEHGALSHFPQSHHDTDSLRAPDADLFERLRNLRGNKTMIFSSHRFGNLTRHADVIMYVAWFDIFPIFV